MTRFQQSTILVCVVRRIVSIVQKKRSIYVWFLKTFFLLRTKIMTNQKSPAHFWARSSGHGPLVMKSSAKDADSIYVVGRPCPDKGAQN